MSKTMKVVATCAVAFGIAAFGWTFFRQNMSALPIVRDCAEALSESWKDPDTIVVRGARLAIAPDFGASVVLDCEVSGGSVAPGKVEARFPLRCSSKDHSRHVGACPFEDPALSATEVEVSGLASPLPLARPVRGVPTPMGMRKPTAVGSECRDGLVYGPRKTLSYTRLSHFFRYSED